MNLRLLLLLAGLISCPGVSSVDGQLERVQAFAGGHAILPCSFEFVNHEESPEFEWSKEGPDPTLVFIYRQNHESYVDKSPEFDYRASGMMRELKDWNVSLRISSLKLSDAGIYTCKNLKNYRSSRAITRVELLVAAEPQLSVVSAEPGLVTLMCETGCWLPQKQPEMTFLDADGHKISAEDPKRQQDERGCYNMTKMVTLQRNRSSKVTCRVHEPEFGQTRDTCILVAADCECSCVWPIIIITIAIAIAIAIAGAAVISGFFLLRKTCAKSAENKQPKLQHQESDESMRSGESEERILLPQSSRAVKADNELNVTIEKLKTQLASCESKICEQHEIIRQLQNRSPISPVACHHNKPVTGRSSLKPTPDVPKPPNQLSTASTTSNPQKSLSLPQGKGQNLPIQASFNNPASSNLFQTSHMRSLPLLPLHHQDPSSASKANKKPHPLERSQSFCLNNGKLLNVHPPRRTSLALSFTNRYSPLSELPGE